MYVYLLILGENYCWNKISYMKYLSGSNKSPFDEGCKRNFSYVFCNKSFLQNEEKSINWKKQISLRYQNKIKMDIEMKVN